MIELTRCRLEDHEFVRGRLVLGDTFGPEAFDKARAALYGTLQQAGLGLLLKTRRHQI
jgi:hypothetical protein